MSEKKELLAQPKPNGRGFAPIVAPTLSKAAAEADSEEEGEDKESDAGEEGDVGDSRPGEGSEEEQVKAKKSVKKAAPPFGGKESKEEEEAEEKKEKPAFLKKSDDVSAEDLEKSIAKLAEFTEANDKTSRKDSLLAKAQAGSLSKSEHAELFAILGGQEQKPAAVAEQITKGLSDNDTLQKALDVSDYLQEQHTELVKSLGALGEHVEQAGSRQHEFNLILAKAVADVGTIVKSLSERMGAVDAQPVRAPKSRGVQGGVIMQKSFAGAPRANEGLSKNQILDGLENMLKKSQEGRSAGNEDILLAISKYEQTNQISKSLLAEVTEQLHTAH